MINIDFLTLRAFCIENSDFFSNAYIQKIQQPTRRDLILHLRNNSVSRKLYININPNYYHIAFIKEETFHKRGIEIPKQPPMFCMLLRKYMENTRIKFINSVENERIFELHFDCNDEFTGKHSMCMAVELMGKYSNIILYDKADNTIIGCAHNVGAEKSRYRELQGGLKYIYPLKTSKFPSVLEEQFKNLSNDKKTEYLTAQTFRPALTKVGYTLFSELAENPIIQKSVNEMLDNYYSYYQEQQNIITLKSKLNSVVSAKEKKVNSSIKKIEKLMKERDNIETYKLYGDLLTANLYKNCDYSAEIEVLNYVNNQNIKIPLDNTKTLPENAQNYYKLYTKAKTTKEKSEKLINDLKFEKEYLNTISYSINSAEELEVLREINAELNLEQNSPKKVKLEAPSYITLKINNFDVYVGKNNKQNDYLVTKLAKQEDYWFHVHNCTGSHVILKVENNEPDEKTIYECCKLAQKYSSANLSSKVGVIYTKRKFLKKPPQTPLGYVTYKNEKEIIV
ncbi:MAG: NFACT family protein [bacterium]|nr:NFACT family protein [bacterium]